MSYTLVQIQMSHFEPGQAFRAYEYVALNVDLNSPCLLQERGYQTYSANVPLWAMKFCDVNAGYGTFRPMEELVDATSLEEVFEVELPLFISYAEAKVVEWYRKAHPANKEHDWRCREGNYINDSLYPISFLAVYRFIGSGEDWGLEFVGILDPERAGSILEDHCLPIQGEAHSYVVQI